LILPEKIKIMKRVLIIFSLTSLVAIWGCKKNFLDVNVDPNRPTSGAIGPQAVLPNALNVTAGRNGYLIMDPGPTFTSGWMGYWAISGSYAVSGSDFTTYKMTTDFGGTIWQGMYDNIEDYQSVINDSRSTDFLKGIAMIMKAVNFQYLVDMFNNVPYSDALKATEVQFPKYDDAASIYGDNFKQINAAMALIKADQSPVPGASVDIMFAGDKNKWMQFANTVKLRMLIRMSEMATKPAFFQAELNTVKADPAGFLTTDALVQPGYSNATAKGNPFWQRYFDVNGNEVSSFGDYYRANQYSIDFLVNNNDQRLPRIYAPATSSNSFTGSVLGKTGGLPGNQLSRFGPGILVGANNKIPVPTGGAAAPAVMLLSAESYFLQAEAALRGWINGTPSALYQNGVTASFAYLGVPNAADSATKYYSQAGNKNTTWAATAGLDEQLNLIIRQKWVALNSINSFEAWSDWRRFEYLHPAGPLGDIPLSISPNIDVAKIPYRLLYPTIEINTNKENVLAQGTINHQTSKIFWMR
jgi:hypothetical protein